MEAEKCSPAVMLNFTKPTSSCLNGYRFAFALYLGDISVLPRSTRNDVYAHLERRHVNVSRGLSHKKEGGECDRPKQHHHAGRPEAGEAIDARNDAVHGGRNERRGFPVLVWPTTGGLSRPCCSRVWMHNMSSRSIGNAPTVRHDGRPSAAPHAPPG